MTPRTGGLSRFRSLPAQSILWIVLPPALITFSLILAGVLAYQRVVTSLLMDRDRQLAIISAARVTEDLADYTEALEELAARPDFPAYPFEGTGGAAEEDASRLSELFDSGVYLVTRAGGVSAAFPAGSASLPADVAETDYFIRARRVRSPVFSRVLGDAQTGADMVVVAFPLENGEGVFQGALLGCVSLNTTSLGDPLKRLKVGDEGFAYLVDQRGWVIYHPDSSLIGEDFSARPFVTRVIAGESGGFLWEDPAGEQLLLGFSPVGSTGWGLVVREPWDSVVAPARTYAVLAGIVLLLAFMIAAFILWQGVRRIIRPIQLLDDQTRRLAAAESLSPVERTGIRELDALSDAFEQMGRQIATYRSGLRIYLGAMTRSQEEERLRLALELHDVTIQSLIAIARRVELLESTVELPEARAKLVELRDMVEAAMQEVREISRDLRPIILEDLGLGPALRALIEGTRNWEKPHPTVQFELEGGEHKLHRDRALALYRITQEALSNIRKHASATNVRVRLIFEEKAVTLEIADNGSGFEVPASFAELAQGGHFGLLGIQERVWAVGGTLQIQSSNEQGTRLRVALPPEPGAGDPEEDLNSGTQEEDGALGMAAERQSLPGRTDAGFS